MAAAAKREIAKPKGERTVLDPDAPFCKALSNTAFARFSQVLCTQRFGSYRDDECQFSENLRPLRPPDVPAILSCTIFCHRPVDGVHSIEKTCSYKGVIFIDEKNRRSTTGPFFDSFLSFSGWCGVRGSSEVTLHTEK